MWRIVKKKMEKMLEGQTMAFALGPTGNERI
jgi:hypothetical protein